MKIMKNTLRTKSSNNRIVILLMILGLFTLLLSGCQQATDMAKNAANTAPTNTAANSAPTNTAANSETAKANTATQDANTSAAAPPKPDNCDGPGDDEVIVYEHVFYDNGGGKCVKLKPSEYKNATEIGLANDTMSSIKIGVNVRATVCDGENFTAPCEEFEKTDYDLMNNPTIKNDTASSIKVVNVKSDQAPEKKPEAIKAFVNTLVGDWIDVNNSYKLIFAEDKMESRRVNDNELTGSTPYKVVDGKTVEFTFPTGGAANAVITFEDNGNILIWYRPDSGQTFKMKRVKPN